MVQWSNLFQLIYLEYLEYLYSIINMFYYAYIAGNYTI